MPELKYLLLWAGLWLTLGWLTYSFILILDILSQGVRRTWEELQERKLIEVLIVIFFWPVPLTISLIRLFRFGIKVQECPIEPSQCEELGKMEINFCPVGNSETAKQ